ncbi:hypothetical protein [Nannocystis punicea]|uniref:DUF4178 domain-containing protein n=1 Tax=Nannocystis punicea TaxID=2995304 RepID=A0ABY7GSV0_9BACT|nr:hypothetical protein [Nannocystis poenicansa]WAS89993.1 hypothetical protein O0S08_27685 [Nannocystis poenicansa]
MSDTRLELYRQRFRSAPVGVWSHAVGTFAMIMNQVWTIRPDHTGMVQWLSGSGELRFFFEWQEAGDYLIRVRDREWIVEADGEPPDAAEPEDDEPEPWIDLRYEFSLGNHGDFPGEFVLLRSVGSEGFWWSDFPLILSGGAAALGQA